MYLSEIKHFDFKREREINMDDDKVSISSLCLKLSYCLWDAERPASIGVGFFFHWPSGSK